MRPRRKTAHPEAKETVSPQDILPVPRAAAVYPKAVWASEGGILSAEIVPEGAPAVPYGPVLPCRCLRADFALRSYWETARSFETNAQPSASAGAIL